MRRIWLVGLIAGCGFSSSAAELIAGPSGDGDGNGEGARCDASDPALRLCMSFDYEPMQQDLSGYANPVAEFSQVTRVDHDGSWAAQLTAASRLRVAEAPDLDLA